MSSSLPVVLVIDDEPRVLEALRRTLDEEFEVFTATNTREAEVILGREWVQVVLCDQRMPGENGVQFLGRVREQWPDSVRIILSGYTESEDIIAGINQAGIHQYITKPWNPDSLLLTVRAAAHLARLQRDHQALTLELRQSAPTIEQRLGRRRQQLRDRFSFRHIIHAPDSPMRAVCQLAERIAVHDIPLLITGESGTGKELVARAVHYGSPRADKPFVVQNCGALPDQLLESELFGYRRGAFTGAVEDRTGLFSQADGGTLFLDEIGDVSPAFQVKLLRALQEGEIRPLGAARSQRVDVRIIAATNRELEADVRAGRFREDLYYRLSGFVITVPPLRDRPEDILPIAHHLLDQHRLTFHQPQARFSQDTESCLTTYPWPGNVRELGNEIRRLLALTDTPLLAASLLSPRVVHLRHDEASIDPMTLDLARLRGDLRQRVETLEKAVLRETLLRHQRNKTRTAEELGLSRVGLRKKLIRYGLEGADRQE